MPTRTGLTIRVLVARQATDHTLIAVRSRLAVVGAGRVGHAVVGCVRRQGEGNALPVVPGQRCKLTNRRCGCSQRAVDNERRREGSSYDQAGSRGGAAGRCVVVCRTKLAAHASLEPAIRAADIRPTGREVALVTDEIAAMATGGAVSRAAQSAGDGTAVPTRTPKLWAHQLSPTLPAHLLEFLRFEFRIVERCSTTRKGTGLSEERQ